MIGFGSEIIMSSYTGNWPPEATGAIIFNKGAAVILKLVQGAFIGVALILPGLSAGTVILILGFYRSFIDDLSALRIRPYLPMLFGAALGVLAAVYVISYLLMHYNTAVMAFLFGMLLASVPAVVEYRRGERIRPWPLLLGIAGFLVTWFIVCEPSNTFTVLPPGGSFHFFLGGALASATMLLPGVSGSSVLIIMNLYDDVIHAITEWEWLKLAFLAGGFVVGLFGLARLLSALYRRFQVSVSFLLAGLILGSTRILLPVQLSLTFFLAAIAGALLVLFIIRRRKYFKID
jgi:putative membrane protein